MCLIVLCIVASEADEAMGAEVISYQIGLCEMRDDAACVRASGYSYLATSEKKVEESIFVEESEELQTSSSLTRLSNDKK